MRRTSIDGVVSGEAVVVCAETIAVPHITQPMNAPRKLAIYVFI
jgi:hypothetical protein